MPGVGRAYWDDVDVDEGLSQIVVHVDSLQAPFRGFEIFKRVFCW